MRLCAEILHASPGEKRIIFIMPTFVPGMVLWNVLFWRKYFSFSSWTISLLKYQIYWETYKWLNILNPGKGTVKSQAIFYVTQAGDVSSKVHARLGYIIYNESCICYQLLRFSHTLKNILCIFATVYFLHGFLCIEEDFKSEYILSYYLKQYICVTVIAKILGHLLQQKTE